MKRRTPADLSAVQTKIVTIGNVTRRQFFDGAGKIIAATALTTATASMLLSTEAGAASGISGERTATSGIKLVNDYNLWFFGVIAKPINLATLRDEMRAYISNETVLNEALSLPWGGTMVGYDGWVHLCQVCASVGEKLSPHMKLSDAHYTQRGNVIFRESTMTIASTNTGQKPFVMPIIEKYLIRNSRIQQIDVFFQDTAGFVENLTLLGVPPKRN
jgi:hypothetical protein